jgi:hypothetical protein
MTINSFRDAHLPFAFSSVLRQLAHAQLVNVQLVERASSSPAIYPMDAAHQSDDVVHSAPYALYRCPSAAVGTTPNQRLTLTEWQAVTPIRTAITTTAMSNKTLGVRSSAICPPDTGSTAGVTVRPTVAAGTGVSLGGFSGGGCGVFVGGGGTGVLTGVGTGVSGGGVGVKPAIAGIACQGINARVTRTEKVKAIRRNFCGMDTGSSR